MLCSLCHSIWTSLHKLATKLVTSKEVFVQHENLQSLKISADHGCHLCSLLYGSLELSWDHATLPNIQHRLPNGGPLQLEIEPATDRGEGMFDFGIKDIGAAKLQCSVRKVTAPPDQTPTIPETAFKNSTSSDTTISVAARWLEWCLFHHENCRETCLQGTRVPTRLLHVNDPSSCVKLEVLPPLSARYLILSYCWGEGEDDVMLTKNCVDDFLISITITDLPETIQDAITVTRKLGYNYLWVDRLCIFQDSRSDWESEASRMANYYLNADCCIAALASPSSDKGCFVSRNALMLEPLRRLTQESIQLEIWPSIGGIQGDYPRLFRGPKYALSSRAWTLQERLLAPRTIYFGSLMIYWECRQSQHSELRPEEELSLPFGAILQKFGSVAADRSADLCRPPQSENEMKILQERWGDLVTIYTSRRLTYSSDRLVAIDGMIRLISERAGVRFIFGLLLPRLTTELLWWQWTDYGQQCKRLPAVAPTWSWGGVQGRVEPFASHRYFEAEARPWKITARAEIIENSTSITPQPESQSSHPFQSKIDFDGPMIPATCHSRRDRRHNNWRLLSVVKLSHTISMTVHSQLWPDEPLCENQQIWLVNMAEFFRIDSRTGQPMATYAGIAIDRVSSGPGPAYWKRIGYWESENISKNFQHDPKDLRYPETNLGMVSIRSVTLI
jgi:Heterokaryon incompatibility protein (HET)